MAEKVSVIELENYDMYGWQEFENEQDAILVFRTEVKGYVDMLKRDDFKMRVNMVAGMIKITMDDYSDKIRSYMLCGLSKCENERIMKELYEEGVVVLKE